MDLVYATIPDEATPALPKVLEVHHLDLYINNAYTSAILVGNSCNYETGNLWDLGCIKFSGRNSGMNETGIQQHSEISNI